MITKAEFHWNKLSAIIIRLPADPSCKCQVVAIYELQPPLYSDHKMNWSTMYREKQEKISEKSRTKLMQRGKAWWPVLVSTLDPWLTWLRGTGFKVCGDIVLCLWAKQLLLPMRASCWNAGGSLQWMAIPCRGCGKWLIHLVIDLYQDTRKKKVSPENHLHLHA